MVSVDGVVGGPVVPVAPPEGDGRADGIGESVLSGVGGVEVVAATGGWVRVLGTGRIVGDGEVVVTTGGWVRVLVTGRIVGGVEEVAATGGWVWVLGTGRIVEASSRLLLGRTATVVALGEEMPVMLAALSV